MQPSFAGRQKYPKRLNYLIKMGTMLTPPFMTRKKLNTSNYINTRVPNKPPPENNKPENRYNAILEKMFQLPPEGRKDPKYPAYDLNGTIVIKMKDFDKPLSRAYAECKLEPYLLECQIMGGFMPNASTFSHNWWKPNIIYERLAHVALKNLVAFSEGGTIESKDYNPIMLDELTKVFGDERKLNESFRSMAVLNQMSQPIFNDTGFVYKHFNEKDLDLTSGLSGQCPNSFLKYISSNGLNILNLHLPSAGPIKIKEQKNDEQVQDSIVKFLDENLPSQEVFKGNLPHVIIGDTNITISKCWGTDQSEDTEGNKRKNILRWIKNSMDMKYTHDGHHWVIIMSPIKVEKTRGGGLLNNNQMYKSNVGNKEEDGTIIAIRCPVSNVMPELIPELGSHYQICWGLNDEDYSSSVPQEVQFLTFDTAPSECLNDRYMPQDKLFIDHPIVQISFKGINLLQGKLLEDSENQEKKTASADSPQVANSWTNLVVLNLGSIINSGKKNWKISLMDGNKTETIREADINLFNSMVTALTQNGINSKMSEKEFNYTDFIGPEFGELLMSKTEPFLTNFAEALQTAHTELESKLFRPTFSGGYKKRIYKTNKKYKRKSKKYKTNKKYKKRNTNPHKRYKTHKSINKNSFKF